MSNEVPDGWQTLAFSEAVIVNPKRSLPKSGAVPFLDMASLPLHGAPVHIIDARPVASGGSKFQKGDTLFARITPCAENGKLGFVSDIDGGPVAQGSTEFIVMGPRDGVTLPEYVRSLSGWDYVRSHAIGLMEGTSGRQRIPAWAFDEIEVGIPPLDEQRRIAEVLRSVDEAIAAANAVIEQLRVARSHRLEALMALPGVYRRLAEICRLSGGYGFPIKHQGKTKGRYPFAKVSDMNRPGNEVQLRDAENYVDEADLRTLKAKTFPVGTTFFPKVGATLLTNKRRIAAVEMLVDNNVMGAVATDVDPWFLYYAFCTIDMADYVQPGAVPSVNQRTIGQIMIPTPTRADQAEFVQNMRDFDVAIEMQSDALKKLSEMKTALADALLTGRVRVPVLAASTAKTVPPAFKRAVFAAEIVHQLHNDNRFGSVKHEKIVHLCELHLGLQEDLDRRAYKEAAGPYDPKARRSVEGIFRQQKWFDATKPDGSRVVYLPLEKAGGHAEYFDRYFGEQKGAIQSIIDLLRPLNTEQCEIVATLYAVWNDFLIDKRQPDDDEIVASVLQWHPKKQQIAKDRWLAALPWMRQKGLIPKGTGEKTRVAQA